MKRLNTILAGLTFLVSVGAQAEIAVIVHSSNNDTLDQSTIERIFLGKLKTFPGGQSAVPINLAEGNATRAEFDQKVLKKSAQQLKSYWSQQIFTGKGKPPREEDTAASVVELVKANPNLIGFVDAADVTPDVKVVATF